MQEFIEIPATKQSLSGRKLMFGIGINDADYIVQPRINGKSLVCPYYKTWASMMKRGYSEKFKSSSATYVNCSVSSEWHLFSRFKVWMTSQNWQGKEIDKDILNIGNKVYSSRDCIFVSHRINSLLLDSGATRGRYPRGVSLDKDRGTYEVYCRAEKSRKFLGRFNTVLEAESTYLKFKALLINKIAFESEAANNPKLQAALLRHARLFMSRAIDIENTMNNELQ